MLKKGPLELIVRVFPAVLLFGISTYFAYTSWKKYSENTIFQDKLVYAVKLETLEYAILNERLCLSALTKKSNNLINICEKTKKRTDSILKDDGLEDFSEKIKNMRKNFSIQGMDNFATVSEKNGIVSLVNDYIATLEEFTNEPIEKELLRLYVKVSNIASMTEVEKILVTYYLSRDIPISSQNFIYWDKIVSSSYFPELENEVYVPSVKKALLKISKDKDFVSALQKIDDMRIVILTKGSTARYTKNNAEWITILNKKQEGLHKVENTLLSAVHTSVNQRINSAKWVFIFFIILVLIALASLVYMYKILLREKEEDQALFKVIKNIHRLPVYQDSEKQAMNNILHHIRTKEDLFEYINSSFNLLLEKEKQSEDEAEIKNKFLSIMSHEIRTPLNGILGFIKLFQNTNMTEDQKEFISLINKSSHHLISIINDVLDLSKIDADKMVLENASFDIFDMVENTVSSLSQLADNKDIEFGLFIDPFLSDHYMGDGVKLSRVIINLVGNALKFTHEYGKVNIFVQNKYDTEYESEIKFIVHDDGVGLTEEEQKNIFNPYTQASSEIANTYGGTGLGLSISSKIIELMGGKIEVESKKKHGSKFFFTITLNKDKVHRNTSYPDFSDISVGLALPVKSINRQIDANLESYVRHLKANYSLYYYEDLFESEVIPNLPDIMIFDHHYARLAGELELCASVECKSILLTNGSLRSRINPERHHFSDVILTPVTLTKTIRMLRVGRKVFKKNTPAISSVTKEVETSDGLNVSVDDPSVDVVPLVPEEVETSDNSSVLVDDPSVDVVPLVLKEVETSENSSVLVDDPSVNVVPLAPKEVETSDGLSALVADDYPINRKLMQILLEKLGFKVTTVENGEDALKMRQEKNYNIIFMDIEMPIMDGIESTKRIREYEEKEKLDHIPIVVITAELSVEDKKSYKKKGIDDLIRKPIGIKILKLIISKHCGIQL